MLACGRIGSKPNEADVCIVRALQPQTTERGLPLLTKFDCQELLLSTNLYVLSATSIYAPISIAHVCSDTCTFTTLDPITYMHDLTNNMFCNNIFCIGNNH